MLAYPVDKNLSIQGVNLLTFVKNLGNHFQLLRLYRNGVSECIRLSSLLTANLFEKNTRRFVLQTLFPFSLVCKVSYIRRYVTKKETLTQVFSCEFCKIFKNTFCSSPLEAASVLTWIMMGQHLQTTTWEMKCSKHS